jgi:uncharacterized protein
VARFQVRIPMATLARIHLHPFKSLDPQSVADAVLLPNGALKHDRRFGLVDEHYEVINGKRVAAIHRLRSHFDPASGRLTLRVEGTADEHAFQVDQDRTALQDWLGAYFGLGVEILENFDGGFPDDPRYPGPTVVSTASLEVVASWYPGLTVEGVRARFRANLEIRGVEPFWEDRLLAPGTGAVRFRIGDVEFLGMNPCERCIVPTRDALTSESIPQFAKTFARQRQQTLPEWASAERFDHFYRLAVNTRAAADVPRVLHVGDVVEILSNE